MCLGIRRLTNLLMHWADCTEKKKREPFNEICFGRRRILSHLSCRVFVSPIDPVVVDLSLVLLGYSGMYFLFLFVLSFGSGREIQLKKSSLGSGRLLVSLTLCFGQILSVFSSIFEAISTHICQLLLDTRHPAAFPVVFRLYCRKYWSCGSPELGAWSSRARESLLSNCTWRPRSAFSGHA